MKRKKSFLDWCSGSEKESLGLLLAPSKGAWIVEEASLGNTGKENFHLSRFATVFEVPWFTEYYKLNDPSFNFSYCKIKGRQASPGKLLYELITLKLHQSTLLNECIYIKRIRVELLQRTTTKSAKGYQVARMKHTTIKETTTKTRYHMGSSKGKWRVLQLPDSFLNCRIPDVPPSVLSNTVHRAYSVCISIRVHQTQEKTDHNLSTFFYIPIGRKVDLVAESQPPPYTERRGIKSFVSGKEK